MCHPIVCGDGITDVGEQCDDGNTLSDDGCSSACAIEDFGFDCAAGQSLLQLSATDVPLAIPENNPAGVLSTINVADARTIKRAMVQIDNIAHPFVVDLTISLLSPSGDEVILFDERGGDGLLNTLFDDGCVAVDGPIGLGTGTFTGCFSPEAPLSEFVDSVANGAWRLRVVDVIQDTGTLNSWTLGLCVQ